MQTWNRHFARLMLTAVLISAGVAAAQKLPLVTFYSASRGDYFTTSDPRWTCVYFHNCSSGSTTLPAAGYVVVGLQGHVFDPAASQPANTNKLFHWFNPTREDNFLTSDSRWAGALGDVKDGYILFRIEGYVMQTGLSPLISYWNAAQGDNAALANWKLNGPPPGYTQYRTEGFLLPPDNATCSGTPVETDPSPWLARANYVDHWSPRMGFFGGDRVRFTEHQEGSTQGSWYSYDYWWHSYPVRGYSWNLAPSGFPAPGVARLSLLASVTSGRAYVEGHWYEAGQWFRALGEQDNWDGPCIYYDTQGTSAGLLQTRFNDDNIGDNDGAAHITMKQWF